jgi:hypothetical protein
MTQPTAHKFQAASVDQAQSIVDNLQSLDRAAAELEEQLAELAREAQSQADAYRYVIADDPDIADEAPFPSQFDSDALTFLND